MIFTPLFGKKALVGIVKMAEPLLIYTDIKCDTKNDTMKQAYLWMHLIQAVHKIKTIFAVVPSTLCFSLLSCPL